MTDIRDLMGCALSAAPTPSTPDPLAAITRRARFRQAASVATTLVVVAAVAALAVTLPGGSGHAAPAVGPTPTHPSNTPANTTKVWQLGGPVTAIATGLGYAWLDRGSFVEQATLAGKVVHTFTGQHLTTVTDITVAGGRVWLLGTSGHGVGLTAYDPVSREERTTQLPRGAGTLFGTTAYWQGRLWISEHLLNEILGFGGTPLTESPRPVSDPQSLAVTGRGQLWVEHDHFTKLTRISYPTAAQTTVRWDQPIFATGPGAAVWSTDGSRVIGLDPPALREGDSVAQGYRLQGHGKPTQVIDATGGIYASTGKTTDYWSTHQVRTGYRPSASRESRAVPAISEIAADGHGVLIVQSGTVTEWTPKAS